VKFNQKNFLF